MPINIPTHLPAKQVLESEHIFVMDESRAFHQDIRPQKIIILNLMPKKSKRKLSCSDCLGIRLCRFIYIFNPKHSYTEKYSKGTP